MNFGVGDAHKSLLSDRFRDKRRSESHALLRGVFTVTICIIDSFYTGLIT